MPVTDQKPKPVRRSSSPMAGPQPAFEGPEPPAQGPRETFVRYEPPEVVESVAAPQPEPESAPVPKIARRPFGRAELKMARPKRPGFVRRWFNDSPGRIARAQEAGYVHVLENGSPVSMIVGKHVERGGGMQGFLMEIPQEFYDEDFARKQEALDELDKTIYEGGYKKGPGDENRYIPTSTPMSFGVGYRQPQSKG